RALDDCIAAGDRLAGLRQDEDAAGLGQLLEEAAMAVPELLVESQALLELGLLLGRLLRRRREAGRGAGFGAVELAIVEDAARSVNDRLVGHEATLGHGRIALLAVLDR